MGCGCRTAWIGKDITIPSVADIEYCPMHAAAEDMLAALGKAADALRSAREGRGVAQPAIEAIDKARAKARGGAS
jgi:hypothetical protein